MSTLSRSRLQFGTAHKRIRSSGYQSTQHPLITHSRYVMAEVGRSISAGDAERLGSIVDAHGQVMTTRLLTRIARDIETEGFDTPCRRQCADVILREMKRRQSFRQNDLRRESHPFHAIEKLNAYSPSSQDPYQDTPRSTGLRTAAVLKAR